MIVASAWAPAVGAGRRPRRRLRRRLPRRHRRSSPSPSGGASVPTARHALGTVVRVLVAAGVAPGRDGRGGRRHRRPRRGRRRWSRSSSPGPPAPPSTPAALRLLTGVPPAAASSPSTMGEPGPSCSCAARRRGGIRRHVDALAAELPARGWTPTVLAVPGDARRGGAPSGGRRPTSTSCTPTGSRVGWWASVGAPPATPRRDGAQRRPRRGGRVAARRCCAGSSGGCPGGSTPSSPRRRRWPAGIGCRRRRRRARSARRRRPPDRPPTPYAGRGACPAGAPLVVAVGRLHPQKGLDVLLDAVAARRRPRARRPAWCSWARGRSRAHLRRRIAADGLADRGPPRRADRRRRRRAAPPPTWWRCPRCGSRARWSWPRRWSWAGPVVATPVGFVPDLVTDGETGRARARRATPAPWPAALADLLVAPDRGRRPRAPPARSGPAWLDRAAPSTPSSPSTSRAPASMSGPAPRPACPGPDRCRRHPRPGAGAGLAPAAAAARGGAVEPAAKVLIVSLPAPAVGRRRRRRRPPSTRLLRRAAPWRRSASAPPTPSPRCPTATSPSAPATGRRPGRRAPVERHRPARRWRPSSRRRRWPPPGATPTAALRRRARRAGDGAGAAPAGSRAVRRAARTPPWR